MQGFAHVLIVLTVEIPSQTFGSFTGIPVRLHLFPPSTCRWVGIIVGQIMEYVTDMSLFAPEKGKSYGQKVKDAALWTFQTGMHAVLCVG